MKPLPLVAAMAAIALLGAASIAFAGPHADSDSEVDGTKIHQEINIVPDAIHYWFHASNPAGVSPFCVTLQLEKQGPHGWRGIGMGGRRGVSECCPQTDEECFPTDTDG